MSRTGLGEPLRFGIYSRNPKVQTAYERLAPRERRQLAEAFRAWIQRDCLGFTLLGYKPMSFLQQVDNPAPVLKLWKRVAGLMNRDKLVFQNIPGWNYLFFANKEALKDKLTQHTPLFQKAADAPLTPDEILSSLEHNRPVDQRHFFDHLLQGIMLGFGAKNASFFARRDQLDLTREVFPAYETTLVRQGPTKTLTEKQFADVVGSLDFFLQVSPMWQNQLRSLEHRQAVTEAVKRFKALNPADGIPKSAVFDIVDLVFKNGASPAESGEALDAESLAFYRFLEEGGFKGSEKLFAGDDYNVNRPVRIPYFMAVKDDTEPAEMMRRSLARVDAMEGWIKSPGFFRSLLESLTAENPSQRLEKELDNYTAR